MIALESMRFQGLGRYIMNFFCNVQMVHLVFNHIWGGESPWFVMTVP